MKRTWISALLLTVTLAVFGQSVKKDSSLNNFNIKAENTPTITNEHLKFLLSEDTVIRVTYKKEKATNAMPAYLIDNKLFNPSIAYTLSPNAIEKMIVKNENVEVDGEKYHGLIQIQLKKDYAFNPISLNELKKKYLTPSDEQTILMVDGNIITKNYINFIVNERHIYKIEVQQVDNKEEGLNLKVINLITRTEDNIKNSNKIMIRGEK
ncbi:MAG: hypothetical protein H6537_00370 [Bacteroidales bacterium]|nr:hypothetical protein [Bacteroidales bacterium]